MNKLRVFLADDHAIIRTGLKTLVNDQPDMEVIGEADNGRSAWHSVIELQPDIVVMDVSMPQMNGIQVTEQLKKDSPQIKVLALTIHDEKGYLRQLLRAGASGYVLKRAALEELIQAIRMVAAGGLYIDPKVAGKIVGSYIRKQSVKEQLLGSDLSDRETEVLRLIALGYSNKEIAAQLDLSVRTVETYKNRLMEKLDFHNRADIVRYALHQGWLQDT